MMDLAEHGNGFREVFAGPIDFPSLDGGVPVTTPTQRRERQSVIREKLAEEFYGPIPAAPDRLRMSRAPLPGEQAERLEIQIGVGEERCVIDAALWLPANATGPVPLICGLDFIGPVGLMNSNGFPIDPEARISPRPKFGAPGNRLSETLRGVSAHQWPVSMMLKAGYAVVVSCYGSWVPDDRTDWRTHGVYPLLGVNNERPTGAISLWAWAIMRTLDAAESIEEIDSTRVAVGGHSRLGKAALWATANDPRISAVLANNSGCGGSAPAAHLVGETLDQMADRFPHWTIPRQPDQTAALSFDQHHLLSLIAPRKLYLAAAVADVWADPIGSYLTLKEASAFWRPEHPLGWDWPEAEEIWQSCGGVHNGPLGFHLRPGGHDMLPYDWRQFLDFLGSDATFANGSQPA